MPREWVIPVHEKYAQRRAVRWNCKGILLLQFSGLQLMKRGENQIEKGFQGKVVLPRKIEHLGRPVARQEEVGIRGVSDSKEKVLGSRSWAEDLH